MLFHRPEWFSLMLLGCISRNILTRHKIFHEIFLVNIIFSRQKKGGIFGLFGMEHNGHTRFNGSNVRIGSVIKANTANSIAERRGVLYNLFFPTISTHKFKRVNVACTHTKASKRNVHILHIAQCRPNFMQSCKFDFKSSQQKLLFSPSLQVATRWKFSVGKLKCPD